jgi:hypothetical protein
MQGFISVVDGDNTVHHPLGRASRGAGADRCKRRIELVMSIIWDRRTVSVLLSCTLFRMWSQ